MSDEKLPSISPTGLQVVSVRWAAVIRLLDVEFNEDGSQVRDRVVGEVKLQWPLAKALHGLLTDVIARYEATEGAIQLPKNGEPVSSRTESGK